jgi:hypothetical protein
MATSLFSSTVSGQHQHGPTRRRGGLYYLIEARSLYKIVLLTRVTLRVTTYKDLLGFKPGIFKNLLTVALNKARVNKGPLSHGKIVIYFPKARRRGCLWGTEGIVKYRYFEFTIRSFQIKEAYE